MKEVVAAFNQEKALVGAFSVITNLRMELFEALGPTPPPDLLRPHVEPGLRQLERSGLLLHGLLHPVHLPGQRRQLQHSLVQPLLQTRQAVPQQVLA